MLLALAFAFLILWWYLSGTLLQERGALKVFMGTVFMVAGGLDLAYIITRILNALT